MNGIPCDVCLDLMPLVQDGVASAASEALVEQHLEHCPRCRAIFGGAGQAPPPAPNEQRMARHREKPGFERFFSFQGVKVLQGF